MARLLIDELAGDYDPEEFEDEYAIAVEDLVRAKIEGGEVALPETEEDDGGEVVDLLAALAKSVDKAKKSRGESTGSAYDGATAPATKAAAKTSAAKTSTAKKSSAKKTTKKKSTAKKSSAKKTPAKKTPAKKAPAKKKAS